MASRWTTVRVFISSTFRDMHAERDWLVKRVFPSLRERLEQYRIYLDDIDLRWGVTEDQVQDVGALALCLNQVRRSHPFFIAILGERYGHVPESLSKEALKTFPWVTKYAGRSVTELEVRAGVRMNNGTPSRSLFFFRDSAFVRDVPEEKLADVQAEDAASAQKLARLKAAIRRATLPVAPREDYPCQYRGLRINWQLARHELADEEQAALEEIAKDGIVDPVEYDSLDPNLRNKVVQNSWVDLDGLETFGQEVHDRLWAAIQAELNLPETPPTESLAETDPLAEEADFHERFIESRLRVYVGRKSLGQILTDFARSDAICPCLVTGPSGSGKSAALARFVTNYRENHPDVLVVPHFISASPASTDLRKSLRRFCLILRQEFQLTDTVKREGQEPETIPAEVPEEINPLVVKFRDFVRRVPADRRVLLVIDALNQLDDRDNAHAVHWLPRELPPNLKVVVSCIDDAHVNRRTDISVHQPARSDGDV